MVTQGVELRQDEFGSQAEPWAVAELMGEPSDAERRDATRDIKARRPLNDYVTLYHPDPRNVSSTYLVPVNRKDRRIRIMELLAKTKVINGRTVLWNNPRPMVEAALLPLRCYVSGCARAGGFSTRADLITHVQGKHANEAPLYQKITDKLMELVFMDIPAEQFESLGLTPPEPQTAEVPMDSAPLVEQRRAKGAP